jgi:hypothetical protein
MWGVSAMEIGRGIRSTRRKFESLQFRPPKSLRFWSVVVQRLKEVTCSDNRSALFPRFKGAETISLLQYKELSSLALNSILFPDDGSTFNFRNIVPHQNKGVK